MMLNSRKERLASIIILNYDGIKYVDECLQSVKNQNYPDREVVFVDNNSTDGSLQHVMSNYPWVKIVQNHENLGFAKGNNIGAQHAAGEYLVFLNNDTIVDPRWMENLIAAANSSDAVGICGSKLLDIENNKIIQEVGGFCDIYGFTLGRGLGEFDFGQYDEVSEVFYVSGASLLIKRKIADKIGLFDSEYFFNQEDVDLCWRAWLSGYKVLVNPFSVVYHKGGGSAWGAAGANIGFAKKAYKTSAWRRYHAEKNIIRTLIKNYSISSLCRIMPLFLALYLGEILLYVATCRWNAVPAYVQAVLWNIRNIEGTRKERKRVQSGRRVPDREVQFRMLKGVGKLKRFSQIGVPVFG
jgi:GT2 family glycosyltransferase